MSGHEVNLVTQQCFLGGRDRRAKRLNPQPLGQSRDAATIGVDLDFVAVPPQLRASLDQKINIVPVTEVSGIKNGARFRLPRLCRSHQCRKALRIGGG